MKITNTKIALIIVVLLGILVCVFAVWKLHPTTPSTPSVNQAALAQLQSDLQNVTPHFIAGNTGNGQEPLTPEEQRIRDDLVALYAARYVAASPGSSANEWLVTAQNGIWLDAIGKRYILVTEANVKGATDEILDSQTGEIPLIPGARVYYLASEGRDIALYIDPQAIYTYSLDQASATLVAGSQLTGNETYHSGTSDAYFFPEQTHTKNSITISVFDSSQIVQNPNAQSNAMQTMNKKVRQITLPLP